MFYMGVKRGENTITTGGHDFLAILALCIMNVHSLKIISASSLDMEQIQALKLGGGHHKNKMADTNFFSKVVCLGPKINTGNLHF